MPEVAKQASTKASLADWVRRITAQPMPIGEKSQTAAIEILDSPGRALSDLSAVAERDPMFAVALLRKVNGLREGSGRDPITIIGSAINLLGRARLQTLVLSLGTTAAGRSKPGRVDDYLRLLDRCALAADLSAYWAHSRGNQNPDEMRVAALTRDLGELALAWFANAGYRRIRIAEYRGGGCFAAVSRRILGFGVGELGTALAVQWRMPPTVLTAMDSSQYQEHRSLGPMLASELARHAVNGWYSSQVEDCLAVIADYLGVSSGETARHVHTIAVDSARSPFPPGIAPAARSLVYTQGRLPLPAGYEPVADPAPKSAVRPVAPALGGVAAPAMAAGSAGDRSLPATAPAARTARSEAGTRPAARLAPPVAASPGRSASRADESASVPTAPAPARTLAGASRPLPPARLAAGPAPASSQPAPSLGPTAARRVEPIAEESGAAESGAALGQVSNPAATSVAVGKPPRQVPPQAPPQAATTAPVVPTDAASAKLVADSARIEPPLPPAVNTVAKPAGVASSVAVVEKPVAPGTPSMRAPNPQLLQKALDRCRQIENGTPAKPTDVIQALLRGLHQGLGLPRVVLLSQDVGAEALVLRFQVGPVPGWPRSWRISTASPNLFTRALSKPQGLPIAPALLHQHPALFPSPIIEQVSAEGFWLASIFTGSRAWGLVYAETRADMDPATSFRQFTEACNLAGKALAAAAGH